MKSLIKQAFFLSMLCSSLIAAEVAIENIHPGKSPPLQRKKVKVDNSKKIGLALTRPAETLKLNGELTDQHLEQLRDPRYDSIYLHGVFSRVTRPSIMNERLIVSAVTFHTGLQVFSAQACGLTPLHLEGIDQLVNLTALNLSANTVGLEGVRKIILLKKVRYLDLGYAALDNEAVKFISDMLGLQVLIISLNDKIDDEGVKSLISHKNLQKINIESTRISEEGYNSLQRQDREIKYFPL